MANKADFEGVLADALRELSTRLTTEHRLALDRALGKKPHERALPSLNKANQLTSGKNAGFVSVHSPLRSEAWSSPIPVPGCSGAEEEVVEDLLDDEEDALKVKPSAILKRPHQPPPHKEIVDEKDKEKDGDDDDGTSRVVNSAVPLTKMVAVAKTVSLSKTVSLASDRRTSIVSFQNDQIEEDKASSGKLSGLSEDSETESDDDDVFTEEFIVAQAWENETTTRKTAIQVTDKPLLPEDHIRKSSNSIDSSGQNMGSMGKIDVVLQRFIRQPLGPSHLAWMLMAASFVLADGIILPISVLKLPESTFVTTICWLQRIYWTLDPLVACSWGYITTGGQLEMRYTRILNHYFRTWFLFDASVLVTDWIGHFFQDEPSVESRLQLKYIRLLRLLHLWVIVPQVSDTIFRSLRNLSDSIKIIASIVKIMLFTAFLLHLIACSWYKVGLISLEHAPGQSWISDWELQTVPMFHGYVHSYFWALAQLIGSTDIYPASVMERTFGIFALFILFLTASIVVSSITTSMTQLQIVTAGEAKKFAILRHFLSDHGISSELATRVQQNAKFVLDEQKKNIKEDQVELLMHISPSLQVDLHLEMNLPALCFHPFFVAFSQANKPAMGQICHQALSHTVLHAGDIVFNNGEEPTVPKMYFVIQGRLLYTQDKNELGVPVTSGQWASEPVLWTSWSHYGQLQAMETTRITTVNAKLFQQIATQFKTLEFWTQAYARGFVRSLNASQNLLARSSQSSAAGFLLKAEPGGATKRPLTDLADPGIVDVYALTARIFPKTAPKERKSNSRNSRGPQKKISLILGHMRGGSDSFIPRRTSSMSDC